MSEDIDVSTIRSGDRVKVSLYGLPESHWLKAGVSVVSGPFALLPSGSRWNLSDRHLTITAHEPAVPALPTWWGSLVILGPFAGHGVFIGGGYVFPLDSTCVYVPDVFEGRDVSVVVDRDGNQPAAERWEGVYKVAHAAQVRAEARAEDYAGRYETSHASRMHAEDCYRRASERLSVADEAKAHADVEADRARADLAAFRAEVAKVRDDLDYGPGSRRLSAILDGTDQ